MHFIVISSLGDDNNGVVAVCPASEKQFHPNNLPARLAQTLHSLSPYKSPYLLSVAAARDKFQFRFLFHGEAERRFALIGRTLVAPAALAIDESRKVERTNRGLIKYLLNLKSMKNVIELKLKIYSNIETCCALDVDELIGAENCVCAV